MAIVDLDAHIRAWAIETAMNNPLKNVDEVKITEVDYSLVTFNSQINYQLDNFNPNEEMDTIDDLEEFNKTSLIQQMQIKRTETVTNSYTWSMDHGFSVGVSVSASLKVPFIGGLDTTVETEYSFKKTESETETRSRAWEFQQTVNVPPHSRMVAILMIQKTRPRIPFTLKCSMEGLVKIKVVYTKNGKESYGEISTNMPNILTGNPLANFSYNGYVAYFQTSGVFQASEGIKAIIDLEEFPLSALGISSEDSSKSNEQPTKRWTIPAIPEEELVVEERFYGEESVNADK